MPTFPEHLFDLAFVSDIDRRIQSLAEMAEPENWDYENTASHRQRPVLYKDFLHTYARMVEEEKVEVSDDAGKMVFDTGLVSPNQEGLYAYLTRNQIPNKQPLFLQRWCLPGNHLLNDFENLPEMAHYFDDPSALVYDI